MSDRWLLRRCGLCSALVALLSLGAAATARAADAEGNKPYIIKDGVVDWYTYNGFRRYHSECHVCHGPDGLGSSFGPALTNSLKTMSYEDFAEVVINGRTNVSTAKENVMPAFGLNFNVACFVDDIYAYLKARSDGVLDRGRPANKAPKPEEAVARDKDCMGG